MRFNGLVLIAAIAALSACGGGEKAKTDTAASQPAAGGASTATPAGSAGAMAPVTGTWHEVKMVGDEKGYRVEPADVTIKCGDGGRWIMVSGGPHNVFFQNVAGAARAQIAGNV